MNALRTSMLAGLALVLVGLAAPSPAEAADRRVKIVNDTNHTMVRFYASRASTDSWEEDILGSSTLDPGEAVRINIDDGSGACLYDFKAVFSDDTKTIREDINVCEIGTYTYTGD